MRPKVIEFDRICRVDSRSSCVTKTWDCVRFSTGSKADNIVMLGVRHEISMGAIKPRQNGPHGMCAVSPPKQ
jgi:hypothetical protein